MRRLIWSFKIISLISGRSNKKETSHIMIHYVRGLKTRAGTPLIGNLGPCGIKAPRSYLGRLRPPKRLTGNKCIKMPVIANQWDEENDVHFFMINLHKAMWSRLTGKEGRNRNPCIRSLAQWRLRLKLSRILVDQETSIKLL